MLSPKSLNSGSILKDCPIALSKFLRALIRDTYIQGQSSYFQGGVQARKNLPPLTPRFQDRVPFKGGS